MNVKTNLLFVCFIFMSFNVFAQLTIENLPTAAQYKNIKKHKVQLIFHSKAKVTGILYQITDKAVILLPKEEAINSHAHFVKLAKEDQQIVNTAFISTIQTKKRNVGKGFLIGLGFGAIIGAVSGAKYGSGWGLVGAGLYGIPSGLVGAIVGGLTKQSYKPKDKAKMERLKKKAIMYGY